MVYLKRVFVIVAGLHYLVLTAKAIRNELHVNNCTSLVFGEQVTLLCGSNSTHHPMISAVALSRRTKTAIEPIALWSSDTWIYYVPNGRNWTVTIDNNTLEIQLDVQDLSKTDSGIYYCDIRYGFTSHKTWLNLTQSDHFETEDKPTHRDIVKSVLSEIGLTFGIIGILAFFAGVIFAYVKRRVWLPKVACKRSLKSAVEELQQMENNGFVHSVISEIIGEIETKGVDIEGIYRLSCPQWELTKAIKDIQQDVNAVKSLPVITLCNVIKMLIRELATPLINEDVVQELLRANALTIESEKYSRMKSVLQQLESTHFDCLSKILLHLRRVTERAEINKMTAENLAVVFAPSLLQTALLYQSLEPLAAINVATEENKIKCQVITWLIKNL